MSDNRGIFTLDEFYDLQVSGLAENILDVFLYDLVTTAGPAHGYFAGGMWPVVSTIDRIDYANDTATAAVKGPLDRDLLAQQSTSNSTHGYFAGGEPSGTSKVSRMEFSNDTATTSPKGPLSAVQKYFGAAGNLSFGYYAGNAPSTISTVSRIDYSNDTSTALAKGPLSFAKGNSQGCGNLSFGYFAGGNGNKSSVDRIDYSNDTATASAKGPLENSRSTMAASGTSDFGYWSGGFPYYTKASRIDYSNDTATAVAKAPYPSTVTPYGFSNSAGTGSNTHGYAAGGNGYISYVWRIDYSNDTANGVEKGSLSQGRLRLSAVSAIENGLPSSPTGDRIRGTFVTSPSSTTAYGYIAGGNPTTTYVDRIDFGNDTAQASPKGNLTQQRYNYNQSIGSRTYGYVMGGYTPSVPEPNGNLSSIDRINYSNDTATAPTVANINHSPGLYAGGATGNNDYGYLGGGSIHPGGTYSTIRRFDFSSDTTNTVDKSTLHANMNFHTATGNLSYGYWGGYPSKTTVDRLDYSNDTAASSPKGTLSLSLRLRASVGDSNFGYFSGGQNPSPAIPDGYNDSTIERIDYSNDTATASPKGPMSSARYLHAATGSVTGGYHVGGRIGSSPGSTSDRLDYSNDTSTTSPKGNMTRAARSWSGVSPQEDGLASQSLPTRRRFSGGASPTPAVSGGPAYGYVAHGLGTPAVPSPEVSTTNRIDYSNDTATAVVTGSQTQTGYYSKGVGNGSYGYILSDVPSNNTVASRIDYSNDSAACAPKGPLAYGAWEAGATGNASYGYHGGGYDQAASARTSKVQRLDYSSDTSTAVVKGPLYATHYRTAATGNLSYGYWGGGDNPGTSSLISRVDYASDTSTASPKGPLDFVCKEMAAVGNQTHGYWGGGETPALVSKVQRLEWANDTTTASTKGPLSAANKLLTATGSDSYGYFAGGLSPWPTVVSRVDRIDYSSDTATASPKGNLTTSLYGQSSVSAQENALQNSPTPAIAAPVQPPFSSPTPLPLYPSAFGYGYVVAGPGASTVSRIDYSNDTATGVSKGPDDTSANKASTSSETHGYLLGGYDPNQATTIKRIDYASDTSTTSPKGNLTSEALLAMSGQGLHTPSYGWIVTTYPGGKVDRIDFANDTATASQRSTGGDTSLRAGSTGNQSYAWKVGGSPNKTHTFRLDYGSDTSALSPKGNMDSGIDWPSCFGNQNYAYFGGSPGEENPNFARTSTHRVDYANDTATSVQKGSSPISFGFGTGTSHNDNYGYMGTGDIYPGTYTSSIYRVDYANDTVAASPSGPTSFPAAYASTRTRAVSAADGGMTPGSPYN